MSGEAEPRDDAEDSVAHAPMALGEPGTVVGIDLGTTMSVVALYEHQEVTIITNSLGNRTTPSVVSYSNGERVVGEVAKQQGARRPQNVVFDAKRMIGRKYDDPAIQSMLSTWPFKVFPAPNNHVRGKETRRPTEFVPLISFSLLLLSESWSKSKTKS